MIAIVFYKFMDNIVDVFIGIGHGLRFFFRAITPIFIGVILAYFLYRPMRWIEKKIKQKVKNPEKHSKAVRVWSVVIVYLIFFAIVIGFFTIAIPSLVSSLQSLFVQLPSYIDGLISFVKNFGNSNQAFADVCKSLTTQLEKLKSSMPDLLLKYSGLMGTQSGISDMIVNAAKQVVAFFIDFVAVLFSGIYLLIDKEKIMSQVDRFNRSVMSQKFYDGFNWVCGVVDTIFYRYFAGKILTSMLIGLIAYAGMLIMRVKYAPLIGLVVGVTNVIPYFGPIIGGAFAAMLTVLYDPIKAIWVLLWIIADQQFDGNILGPNVLGRIVELNPFWVLVCVLIGGNFFGPFGMFIAIPVGAVIRVFILEGIDRREKKLKAEGKLIKPYHRSREEQEIIRAYQPENGTFREDPPDGNKETDADNGRDTGSSEVNPDESRQDGGQKDAAENNSNDEIKDPEDASSGEK